MHKFYHRAIIIVTVSLLLSSCGISNAEFETNEFTISYPENWKRVIPKDELEIETEVLLVSIDENGIPELNFNIIKKEFTSDLSLNEFIQTNIDEAASYPNYEEVKIQKIEITDQKTKLHTFLATETSDELGQNKFLQSFVVSGNVGYTITATMDSEASNDLENQVKKVMRSFTLLTEEKE